jgi:hypothetical protein
MSALGHKRTFAPQKAMSAFPPIATAKADFRTRSCLLYPRKRTCAVHQLWAKSGHQVAYSITSPACASSISGRVRPSPLAVLKLITIPYLVGA